LQKPSKMFIFYPKNTFIIKIYIEEMSLVRTALYVVSLTAGLLCASTLTFAENQWSNYQGVPSAKQPRPMSPQNTYPPQGHRPNSPQQPNFQHYPQYPNNGLHRPPVYPNQPRPPQHRPPIQNGISIQYQAPTTIIQNSQTYSWVNGDPATASISSSTYRVVSDWHRLGLPAPPTDMYWIFENGRYVLMPNR
jgi:Ni/Co efflux regulator RcnB